MIVPPWLEVAEHELDQGVAELAGDAADPRILEYMRSTTFHPTSDEVPWCAGFVGWCLEAVGLEPTRSAAARSYLRWGQRIGPPAHGCVVVLRRGPAPWPGPEVIAAPGHVGFLVGKASRREILILGGNQSDAVTVRPFDASRVLAHVWPRSLPAMPESGSAPRESRDPHTSEPATTGPKSP